MKLKNKELNYINMDYEGWFNMMTTEKYDVVKIDIDFDDETKRDKLKEEYLSNLIKLTRNRFYGKIENIDLINVHESNKGLHLKIRRKDGKFDMLENIYLKIMLGDDYAHTLSLMRDGEDVLFDRKVKLDINNIYEEMLNDDNMKKKDTKFIGNFYVGENR